MAGRPAKSLGTGRIDEDDNVTQILPAGLEQDCSIQDDRALQERQIDRLGEARPHQRMNDAFER